MVITLSNISIYWTNKKTLFIDSVGRNKKQNLIIFGCKRTRFMTQVNKTNLIATGLLSHLIS